MQVCLLRASEQLGISAILDCSVALQNDVTVVADALFPDLGAKLGTLVFESSKDVARTHRAELLQLGYTISSFDQPLHDEEFDIDDYKELFSEWGWYTVERPKPSWIT